MTRWWLFLPVGAMTVFAGLLGWRLGAPRSDTVIINFYAADYIAQTGAVANHCAARPSFDQGTRMVIECIQPAGSGLRYIVGPRGGLIRKVIIKDPQA
ncbi:MAG: hypothetical protein KC448_12205 [Yoonia sp.]|nr:hypothetical protein [Yoonia sp.]